MWASDYEARLRQAAFDWLAARTHDGVESLTFGEIREFTFEGERFPLMDRQRGIRKPAAFKSALSIRTVWRPDGAERPYDDAVRADGLMSYKWRGDDPNHPENRALRAAQDAGDPLIWFWGVGDAVYQAIFPIYLIGEDRPSQEFVVAVDGQQALRPTDSPLEEVLRRYLRTETVNRLHKSIFRAMVLRAYKSHCAVCALRYGELLDAAHIVPDRHELGIAAVRNGMALCKIHHAAYDARILGVTPDLVVQVRGDILHAKDGPVLEHGLKGLHGQPLRMVPSSPRERPDRELLALRYENFRAS